MGFILYENILRGATILTDETVGSSASKIVDGRTSSSAKFASGAQRNIYFDCGSAKSAGAVAWARSNAGSTSATINIRSSTDNVTYTTRFTENPTTDKVTVETGGTYSARYWNIQIDGHTSECFITDLALGVPLTLERDQKGGFISPLYANNDEITPNITRGQNLAGITVKPGIKRVKLRLPYYSSSFYSNWSDLIDVLKTYPVYLKWDKAGTKEAFYCWPDKKLPQPAYSKNVANYAYLDAIMNLQGFTE